METGYLGCEPEYDMLPVDRWSTVSDRIPPEVWNSMNAEPPEGSFGVAVFADGRIGVVMDQGQGGDFVWEE